MPQHCSKPECGGLIVEDVCEDCGRLPDGGSLVDKFAQHLKIALLNSKAMNRFVIDDSAGSDYSKSGVSPGENALIEEDAALKRIKAQDRHGSVQHKSLGAGLLQIAPLPKIDPLDLILKDPTVPESKRACGHCDTQFHYMKGFCPKCGREYNLIPTLHSGDIVADQYEIKGPIAFGGLGWIYLAWDKVLSRLVVLKGLLNSKDEVSATAAMQERRYLAAVKHPNIVGIYNFVSHGREGFIVMEYVSGQTLKQVRQEHGPLPVAEAVAFIHRILSAFAHLHKMGLVYCDFKPDNFMFEDDDVKLIDMGAVRRIDETGGDIFCTKGYAAPEAHLKPSVSSDLYTIARSLAVLVINFKLQSDFQFSLPNRVQEPLFETHDSLYRFLLKATHEDPGKRFESAEVMADQLLGILAETCLDQHSRASIDSTIFDSHQLHSHQEGESYSLTTAPRKTAAVKLLPHMIVDLQDPAGEQIELMGAMTDLESVRKNLDAIASRWPNSVEVKMRLCEVRGQLGAFASADRHLEQAEGLNPNNWKLQWYRGKLLMMKDRIEDAKNCFEKLYDLMPGETAPKLALALCAEMASEGRAANETDNERQKLNLKWAKRLYQNVARVDHRQSAAVFGLARCLLKESNRPGAIEALRMVPAISHHYQPAQIAIVKALVTPLSTLPTQKDLVQASSILERMELEGFEKHRLAADLFLISIQVVEQTAFKAEHALILGCAFSSERLRLAAERELRKCARFAQTHRTRCRLVDEANKIRPVTFF